MRKIRTKTGIIFTLFVCTALVLSGCGSKTTESAGDEVSGRVSAFSDSRGTATIQTEDRKDRMRQAVARSAMENSRRKGHRKA